MKRRIGVLGPVLVIAGLIAIAPGLSAQDDFPEEFVNLKVLDPEISKEDLKARMKGFTDQLGVKCTYCHTLGEYDKDDNEHKQVARDMIKLLDFLWETSDTYFPEKLEPGHLDCWTCHRGESEIEPFSVEDDDDWVR